MMTALGGFDARQFLQNTEIKVVWALTKYCLLSHIPLSRDYQTDWNFETTAVSACVDILVKMEAYRVKLAEPQVDSLHG